MRLVVPLILSFLLLLPLCLNAQELARFDTLAIVGTVPITSADLLERIELMPWIERTELGKRKALESLATEKLLVLGAQQYHVALDPATLHELKILEKLFVRDELYKREVVAKFKVTGEEIRDGLRRFARKIRLVVVSTASRNLADSVYGALTQSLDPDSTLQIVVATPAASHVVLEGSFGDFDSRVEDVAFGMIPSHASNPLLIPGSGWAVVYLLNASVNPAYAKMTASERAQHVEKIVRDRNEADVSRKFMGKVLSRQKARVNTSLFVRLAESVRRILQEDSTRHYRRGRFVLSLEVISRARSLLNDALHEPLVHIAAGDMTLDDVFDEFRYHSMGISTLDQRRLEQELNSGIQAAVESELMTREGYRQNLQQSSKVCHDLSVWSDFWLAHLFSVALTDTIQVRGNQVIEFLIKNSDTLGQLYQVNVCEVLSNDPDETASILDSLASGTDIKLLAIHRSRLKKWAERNGESGFFRVFEHPEIGFAALAADSGSIVGPIALREGYSIFRVLGKRKVHSEVEEIDSLLARIRKTIKVQLQKEVASRFLIDLSRRYNITFRWESLLSLRISPFPMTTRRDIGFGGRLQGAPVISPMWEWMQRVDQHLPWLP